MNLPAYPIMANAPFCFYEFLSEGPNGSIKKAVVYQEYAGVYNIAFGDWDEDRQVIDDTARSNNNDRNKVLATVAETVMDFLKHYPDAIIFGEGSTPSRTRLYQMAISNNWNQIKDYVEIIGLVGEIWQPFTIGKNYEAFMVILK